ncbi:MAG: flagellar hook-basal body complex protein [Bradyrhizobium sp.]|nr:flagellar hook-basal body complex protein [Bradyrhizobium sp.]
MGIFDALTTAVGGLQAQSFALQNISGNIANASTIGYKGIGTSFSDLIPDATSPSEQVAGGVVAASQQTITTQGTVSASTVATNMAINGNGFFDVMMPTSTVDNQPVFNGVTDYTQRGDFQVNANGNLVNGAGYYLMGVTVDPTTGNPVGSVPQVLQFQNNFIPAVATSSIQYAVNLPTTPSTTAASTGAAGSIVAAGGLSPADFTAGNNPLVTGTPSYTNNPVTGTVITDNSATVPSSATALSGAVGTDSLSSGFAAGDTITVNGTVLTFVASGATGNQLNVTDTVGTLLSKIQSITGVAPSISSTGAITLNTGTAASLTVSSSNTAAFKALGFAAAVNAAGTPNPGTGAVTADDSTTFVNESISGGAVTAYNSAGTPVNVQLRWALTSTAGGADTWNLFYQSNPSATGTQPEWTNVGTNFTFSSSGALTSPTTGSISIPNLTVGGQSLGTVAVNFGAQGLTQYASTGGTATINNLTQNGFAAGQLQSLAINNNGIVVGTFSNGQNIDLAAVTLSHFNGTNYLQALNGEAYAATQQSGAAIAGSSATIAGSSLEGSNTDIADEFTKLIVTQQAYSANTKVITTANDMIQSLLSVLR